MKNTVIILFLAMYSLMGASLSEWSETFVPTITLEQYKRIDEPARDEVSGMVKSKIYEDTFWVHGDSGTRDHIYAINVNGEMKSAEKEYRGANVKGAKNNDWEDIGRGAPGELILGDIGNNCKCRNDLKIYILREPEPGEEETEVLREYEFRYPEEDTKTLLFFRQSLDAEGIFMLNDEIHIVTKEGRRSRIYKLTNPKEHKENVVEFVDEFPIRKRATAADISPDEGKIAVISNFWLWLLYPGDDGSVMNEQARSFRLKGAEQIESVAFSGDHLIIAEENGGLYRLSLSELEAMGE